MKALIKFWFYS